MFFLKGGNLKNLKVGIKEWQALKKALEPATPFRKKPIRMLLEAIEAEQVPWWKVWK